MFWHSGRPAAKPRRIVFYQVILWKSIGNKGKKTLLKREFLIYCPNNGVKKNIV